MTEPRMLRPLAVLCLLVSAAPALADADGAANPLAFARTDAETRSSVASTPVASPGAATDAPTTQAAARAGGASSGAHAGGAVVKQIPSVAIGCLRPGLVNILRRASAHYGDEVVVTSGYRGGRGRSYHAKCMAADVQIAGVNPGPLARWFRSQPDVGGVGTYGHTRSVHVDVAPRRFSWHGRSARRVRTAEACPCCGGTPHGAKSAFACERGVQTPPIRLGNARA